PELAPWQVRRLALLEHLDEMAVDVDSIFPGDDLSVGDAVVGVVLVKVGEGVVVGEVVDGDHLEQVIESALLDCLEHLATDPAETVDSYLVRHCWEIPSSSTVSPNNLRSGWRRPAAHCEWPTMVRI